MDFFGFETARVGVGVGGGGGIRRAPPGFPPRVDAFALSSARNDRINSETSPEPITSSFVFSVARAVAAGAGGAAASS